MTSPLRPTAVFTVSLSLFASAVLAQHQGMPAGMTHEQHMAQMKTEAAASHHFTTAPDGGAIAMDVTSPGDVVGRDQIRAHLKDVVAAFKQGTVGTLFTTHGEPPPGVSELQRLKAEMSYVYTETPNGGIVRIITGNAEALAALHAFLRHQSASRATAAVPDHLEHRFDNPSEWAKSFDDPARDDWQMPARVIDALQLKPEMKVADIGAGTGYFTTRLAKAPAAPTVFAVDIEKGMIEHIQQRAMHDGLTNIVGVLAGSDRTNLPEPVDLILMVDTYHHIPNRVAYFSALKGRMKPGARLVVIDFRKGAPAGPPEQFRFTPAQISAELGQAGFALQMSHDFLPRQMFLVYGVK